MPTVPSQHVVVEYKRPDRLDDPTEFLADDFHDEDIASAVAELAPICDDFRRHSFAWYYELGKVVRRHYEAIAKTRTSMYGARFFNRLALDLNRPNVDGPLLSCCFRLVKHYSEEEYLGYAQHPQISPTHLLLLAGIGDRKPRQELIQQVIDEGLPTQQLQRAIKEKFGIRREGRPGRPPKVPRNVIAGLAHMEEQAQKLLRLSSEAWFGDRYDLENEICSLPPFQVVNDDLRAKLLSAAEHSEKLATTAAHNAERLRAALVVVDQRREAQAKYNAEVQQAEEEEQLEAEFAAERQVKRPSRPTHPSLHKHRDIGRAARAV